MSVLDLNDQKYFDLVYGRSFLVQDQVKIGKILIDQVGKERCLGTSLETSAA